MFILALRDAFCEVFKIFFNKVPFCNCLSTCERNCCLLLQGRRCKINSELLTNIGSLYNTARCHNPEEKKICKKMYVGAICLFVCSIAYTLTYFIFGFLAMSCQLKIVFYRPIS